MTKYHKINTMFKRNLDKKNKPIIEGHFVSEEINFLKNTEWEWTEKIDGMNIRIDMTGDEPVFSGRTDAAQLPPQLLINLRHMFPCVQDDLKGTMLYGEGYGPKIQKGGKYRETQSFILFDVKRGNLWLKNDARYDVAETLDISAVPVVLYGTIQYGIDAVKGGLPSALGSFEAEGLVGRPVVPMFDRLGNRIITKIKTRDFR